jgi:hypothetical protein
MLYDFTSVVLQTLVGVIAAAILVFGFAFLIFLGDADARERILVSKRFDKLAMLTIYLSWFSLLWWFGFSRLILALSCAATAILCIVYAASYKKAMSRRLSVSNGKNE